MKTFIYCRKSMEAEDRQILSLEGQEAEMSALAAESGRSVVLVLRESMSAKQPGRPVFNDMLRRIERGEADSIITWKLDRLARNFDDGGKVIGLLQRGVIKEIRTFERVYLPSDNVLMIAVELGMANQYVRDLTVNIQRGVRAKIRAGVFPGKAPLGYFNEPKLRTIDPHPEKFDKVKRVLERVAEEQLSPTQAQRVLAKEGFENGGKGKRLGLQTVLNTLRNPFYYGAFLWKGELHQGTQLPMVSKATFDRVQQALARHSRRTKSAPKEELHFLNLANCACCGFAITAERHMKKSGLRFTYYRCTHKNKSAPCSNRGYLRAEAFAEEVKRNVSMLRIPDDWRERFMAKIELWEANDGAALKSQAQPLRAELAQVKSKIERLNTAFAEGAYDVEEFKSLKNPLVPRKLELEGKIANLEKAKGKRLEPLRQWVNEGNSLGKLVSDENWAEMKAFLKKVGSNRVLQGPALTVSFAKPWDSLALATKGTRGDNELSLSTSKWWTLQDSNL